MTAGSLRAFVNVQCVIVALRYLAFRDAGHVLRSCLALQDELPISASAHGMLRPIRMDLTACCLCKALSQYGNSRIYGALTPDSVSVCVHYEGPADDIHMAHSTASSPWCILLSTLRIPWSTADGADIQASSQSTCISRLSVPAML
jgi:hypothetical protein